MHGIGIDAEGFGGQLENAEQGALGFLHDGHAVFLGGLLENAGDDKNVTCFTNGARQGWKHNAGEHIQPALLVISSQSFSASHSLATASRVLAFSCARLMLKLPLLRGVDALLDQRPPWYAPSRALGQRRRLPSRRALASSGVSPLGMVA